MIANFEILSGSTVPKNYTWDIGIPFTSTATTASAFSTTNYVSGYAPGVNVLIRNISEPLTEFEYSNYIWNFGDYYNDINNIVSLSAFSGIQHLYIMPGKYTITLTLKQTQLIPSIDPESLTCIGKHDIRWFWENLQCDRLDSISWDETKCTETYSKWWDSELTGLQKHCKFWSWFALKTNAENPVRWEETKTDTELEKKWAYEANDIICTVPDANFLNTFKVQEEVTVKVGIVEVVEIPPKAQLQCITFPLTGISPYTVTLSPRNSLAGSFPIDRIDWDFNDGSPIKTITRFSTPDPNIFTYTDLYFNDKKDPRNYDAVYTYKRNNNFSVFYPSLTCYSANTSTQDACSLAIGPILLPPFNNNLQILKQRSTENGTIYAGTDDSKLFFLVQNNSLLSEISGNFSPFSSNNNLL